MNHEMRRWGVSLTGLLGGLALLMLSVGPAEASHYRLPADGLVTAKEHRMLEANGLSTTDKVLEYAATTAGRSPRDGRPPRAGGRGRRSRGCRTGAADG